MPRLADHRPHDHRPRPTWPDEAVLGGVDTHRDTHVAAACDPLGRVLGSAEFPTTAAGFAALLRFLGSFGTLAAVGVEGTGSYGSGLARWLAAQGVLVLEVDRPNRQARRRRGKTDTIDAEEAARAVAAGRARTVPKTATGSVEMVRMLRMTRRSASKQRTQAVNQIHALIVTAPEALRAQLAGLTTGQLLTTAARLRPGPMHDPTAAAKYALSALARRVKALDEEIAGLDAHLEQLIAAAAPDLIARHGVGIDTAGALLCAVGDNPHRLSSEKSFAALCGASPVAASSGRTNRHRLNRGGDRQANSALWRIVIVRMRSHPPTQAYVHRRTQEGLSKRDIIRCLKRYVARELYQDLPRPASTTA